MLWPSRHTHYVCWRPCYVFRYKMCPIHDLLTTYLLMLNLRVRPSWVVGMRIWKRTRFINSINRFFLLYRCLDCFPASKSVPYEDDSVKASALFRNCTGEISRNHRFLLSVVLLTSFSTGTLVLSLQGELAELDKLRQSYVSSKADEPEEGDGEPLGEDWERNQKINRGCPATTWHDSSEAPEQLRSCLEALRATEFLLSLQAWNFVFFSLFLSDPELAYPSFAVLTLKIRPLTALY